MQCLGNLSGDAFDAAHRLHIEFLRRELNGSIAGVNARKLNVLTDGIGKNLAVLGHSVHLYLLGVLDEFRNHYGVILRHIGSQLEKALQLVFIGTDIHGCSREYIAGANQNGVAHTLYETADVGHRGQCAPFGLVNTQLIEHL